MGAALTEANFPRVAPLAGALEYRTDGSEPFTVGVLHGYVPQAVEAWQYTLDHLGLFFETAMARGGDHTGGVAAAREIIGSSYLEFVRLLAQRVAELHQALASRVENPAFAPEPFTDFYRHGLYHGILARVGRTMETAHRRLERLPEAVRPDTEALLANENGIRGKIRYLRDHRIDALRIRIHGDLHLGEVLYTGKDFVVIDFEGDPSRHLSERRIKRSPLQDVAGMLDSFYHASHAVLFDEAPGVISKPQSLPALERWAKDWYRVVAAEFLQAYSQDPKAAALLPREPAQVRALLDIFLMDKALQKLAFDLTHAPERVRVPCHAVLELLETS
jgi:maltose alpha-D-glucosyltransferase/alpha-amylase